MPFIIFFFPLPIALAMTFSIMLSRSGNNGHACLVLIVKISFQFNTVDYDVRYGLFIYGLYYIETYIETDFIYN